MAASKLTNEEKLKRLVYISNVNPKYYCGGSEVFLPIAHSTNPLPITDAKHDLLEEIVKTNYLDLLKVVEAANQDNLVPHRTQIFNILACSLKMPSATPESKHAISLMVLKLVKEDTDMFDFIKYASTFNSHKLSKTVRKAITAFYKKKNPLELAQFYASTKSIHGWSHKNLIKLCHLKSETPVHNVVLNYILTNKFTEKDSEEEKKLIDVIKKYENLRKTEDPTVAVPLIQELKVSIDQVNIKLRKSSDVWSAALSNMSLGEILRSMPKLYKLGLLKKDTPTQMKVTEALTTANKVTASKIHPLEVFIHLKNFEKGGKPLDPKLLTHLATEKNLPEEELTKLKTPPEIKSPIFVNYIQKCMTLALSNTHACGKRFLITIDTTDKMESLCLSNKNITGIEAAAAYVWFLLRNEKDVTVAVFKEKEISIVNLEKKGYINDHLQKLKDNKSKYLVLAAPMEWASSNKKQFDVFLNFIHHKEYYTLIPKEVREKMQKPVDALQKYKKKVNLPNAKLVNFCLSSPHLEVADGSPNVLDVTGFDRGVPKLIEAFCRGHFC